MKILIFGAEGTLGKQLSAELERRGHTVFGADTHHQASERSLRCDIAEQRQVERVMETVRPEVVYLLAAEFGRLNGEAYYEQLWKTNAIGTRNVIDACVQFSAKLLFASSSEAYGDLGEDSLLYENLLTERVPNFHNEYALSKWCNEKQIDIARANRGLQAITLRFFNAYGPGEYYTPYRSVVCLFCYRLLNNMPITVYRNYHRVFMYVDDWARSVANVAERFNYLPYGVYNIGGSEYRSVEELVDLIIAEIGTSSSQITYLTKEAANVTNKRPDISRAVQDLEHRCDISLEEGVKRTVEWMRATYELKRQV